ncbi:putative methyltransferase [Actinorhabdospora filicis]|uniref:Methyltransferase n=1 Tax=Actinorhabdospora filicis TaxID=1785913 RepID=A0A9W6W8H9_9ACTN|nr:class I SAM-dependent methyltransferase [Actinorhabdospora filicis]GLZ76988.1 putative methyltransferase [Actinorhabdospora filicis]
MTDPAHSFGQAAGVYDAIRPTYASEPLVWALGTAPLTVVDLGAGTGILSRALAALGHRVIAVEPDAEMLAKLAEKSPGVEPRQGDAEHIPVDSGSVDAVTAGQAYHWFDPAKAHPEIARVLRPGGVFAPIWNLRDETVPWVSRMSELIGKSEAEVVAHAVPDLTADGFERAESHTLFYDRVMTEEDLVTLVKSRSYYLIADEEGRAELERRTRELVRTHPDLAGRSTFELPYETLAYRIRRKG